MLGFYILFSVYAFVLGSCIGSFLNVLSSRYKQKDKDLFGRSKCTSCNTSLKAYDLIPLLSFLLLRGKCRYCKAKISVRYFLTELFCGLLYLLTFIRFGFKLYTLYSFVIISVLFLISLIDIDTMEIPDFANVVLLVIALIGFLFKDNSILSKLIGFLIISLPMLVFTHFIENAFGGGDIKLIAVLGLILGFDKTLLCFFLSLVFGGAIGVSMMLKGEKTKGVHIPFGPYICLGGFISLLFGKEIINAYLGLFGLV